MPPPPVSTDSFLTSLRTTKVQSRRAQKRRNKKLKGKQPDNGEKQRLEGQQAEKLKGKQDLEEGKQAGEKQKGTAPLDGAVKKRKRDKKEPGTPKSKIRTAEKPDANWLQHSVARLAKKASATEPPAEVADEPEQEEPSATPSTATASPEGDDDLANDERVKRTLFVGNVSQTAKRKDIGRLFTPYGAVESVRIRCIFAENAHIPKKVALQALRLTRYTDSFTAYVVFKDGEGVDECMKKAVDEKNMTIFMGKHIKVTAALFKKGPARLSLFVGNLPFDCTEEELIETFMPVAEECGVLLKGVRVNRDAQTGVCRGVGFVTFSDELGVRAAINKKGDILVRDRVIRMERAFRNKKMNTTTYKRVKKQLLQKARHARK